MLKQDGSTWRYRDHASRLLSDQIGLRYRGMPVEGDAALDSADNEQTVQPVLSVLNAANRGEHITFSIRYGRQAGFDVAMAPPEDPTAKDLDIAAHSPSRSYRAALLLPETGEAGALAVESVGTACPRNAIVRWLKAWSRSAAVAPAGEPGNAAPWWKLVAEPLGDESLLDAYIERAEPEQLILTRKGVTADNKRIVDPLKLTVEVDRGVVKNGASRITRTWGKIVRRGGHVSSIDAAHELAALVGTDVAAIDFDDATVVLRDDQDVVKHIKPGRLSDIFIYRLSLDAPPDDERFLSGVRAAVDRVSRSANLSLVWDGWPIGRL